MTIFMVFVCFTSSEGQAPQCHPAYPKQYASADECAAFSQNDSYLKRNLKGVRDRTISTEYDGRGHVHEENRIRVRAAR